ncbi:hypothetical protein BWD14_11795 [Leptospira santarosai]|uniref:Uncharacterized protein n=1 Tax=Leptospira santarosai TaxID=28183 RepID=A0AB73LTV0_9LEPT|nr:hypothetical protein BWD14_11795 [Leptospira santarosai]
MRRVALFAPVKKLYSFFRILILSYSNFLTPLRSTHAGIQDLSSLRTIPLPSKIVVKDQKHFTLRPGGAVEIISPKFLVNLELYP